MKLFTRVVVDTRLRQNKDLCFFCDLFCDQVKIRKKPHYFARHLRSDAVRHEMIVKASLMGGVKPFHCPFLNGV